MSPATSPPIPSRPCTVSSTACTARRPSTPSRPMSRRPPGRPLRCGAGSARTSLISSSPPAVISAFRPATCLVTSSVPMASSSRMPGTLGPKRRCRISAGSGSILRTGSRPRSRMCASPSGSIISARRRSAVRARAAARSASRSSCGSRRAGRSSSFRRRTERCGRTMLLHHPLHAIGLPRKEPMTYCAGILVKQGLVIIADTRTNAGLDNISTYRKLHVIAEPGDRVLTIATAGNLSVSQSVMSLLHEGLENPQTCELETIRQVPTMFRAAQLIGRAIRHVRATDEEALEEAKLSFEVSMLFGGQIRDGPMRLYMIYAAGNFIECGQEAPFLQIGEHKYGKPILDRAVKFTTDLYDALKIGLISMDSTMRSNLGVGLPIDIAVICRDAIEAELVHRIEAGEPYL